MSESRNESSGIEKVNRVIRFILVAGTVGILLVVLYAVLTRGTGY